MKLEKPIRFQRNKTVYKIICFAKLSHHDLNSHILICTYDFQFYSPEAIGVWALSSGERPGKKIQRIL